MKTKILTIILLIAHHLCAQEGTTPGLKYVYFPQTPAKNWQTSVGFTATTMPRDITEELHYRVPAADLHVLKKIAGNLYADGRAQVQVIQNMVSLGPRLAVPLNDRLSLSLGNDFAFWFGNINIQFVKTKGRGFQNTPNFSLGYRFNKSVLLTVKAESIMNFGISTRAGETDVASDYRLFSGSAYSIMLEQPFAGSKAMTLGFRATYTDYHWQTWTLFESFDRNLFFPQFIVGILL